MVKKFVMLSVAAVAAVILTGCSALEVATPADFNGCKAAPKGEVAGHVGVTAHGLYLLWIPLITGSVDQYGVPALLQDTANPTTLADQVTKKGTELGGKRVINLVTRSSSTGLLFQYRSASASGTVIK